MHLNILLKTIALTNKIQYTSVKDIIATILIRQKYKYFPNITWYEYNNIKDMSRMDICMWNQFKNDFSDYLNAVNISREDFLRHRIHLMRYLFTGLAGIRYSS
jgi:hypothetical protein